MNTHSPNEITYALWNPYRAAMPPREDYERYLRAIEDAMTLADMDERTRRIKAANRWWELLLIEHSDQAWA